MLPLGDIVHLLEQYGYLLLFLAAIAEGPIITIIGAFLASLGYFNIFAVYAVVTIGDLSGDLLYYCIGQFIRTGASAGVRRLSGMTREDFTRAERFIAQHGGKMLLFAKYTQTGCLALPAAGAARMPVGKFLWYNALATIPKSLALVIVGYLFGYAYNRINGYFVKASALVFGIICIAGAYVWLQRYLRINYGEH